MFPVRLVFYRHEVTYPRTNSSAGANTSVTLRSDAGTIPALPKLGESLSHLSLNFQVPRLQLPGDDNDSPGENHPHFIKEATVLQPTSLLYMSVTHKVKTGRLCSHSTSVVLHVPSANTQLTPLTPSACVLTDADLVRSTYSLQLQPSRSLAQFLHLRYSSPPLTPLHSTTTTSQLAGSSTTCPSQFHQVRPRHLVYPLTSISAEPGTTLSRRHWAARLSSTLLRKLRLSWGVMRRCCLLTGRALVRR